MSGSWWPPFLAELDPSDLGVCAGLLKARAAGPERSSALVREYQAGTMSCPPPQDLAIQPRHAPAPVLQQRQHALISDQVGGAEGREDPVMIGCGLFDHRNPAVVPVDQKGLLHRAHLGFEVARTQAR